MKLLIIGGGPAGIEAAITGSHYSDDVTMVTNGGVGEWKSALPNMWLTSVNEILEKKSFNLPNLEQRCSDWGSELEERLTKANVKVVHGKAEFHSNSTIKVSENTGKETYFSGDKIIIANGSRPTFPGKIKPDGIRIFSYQNLNMLHTIPTSIIVIGDGPIGYEMANLFQQVGCKVKWMIPTQSQSIFGDKEATDYLLTFYEKEGVEIIRGPWVHELINNGEGVIATRVDGGIFEAEFAFITLGFQSNLDNLQIETTNLVTNRYGSVDTNAYGQTDDPNIYVVGDAQMPFAAVISMAKAHVAILHAYNQEVEAVNIKTIPLAFNENPQVAIVGSTDTSDSEVNYITIPYNTRQFRAFMTDKKEGFLKLVFNKENEIMGGACVGSQAKDIMTTVALMVKLQVKISQVSTFFGSHPSATELPFIAIREYLQKETISN